MKKVLSVLLAVCMMLTMMSALTVQAENKVEIIMDEAGVEEAVGTIASTGGIGVGWKEATHDGFYGGTAMRAAFTNTTYTYTFQPKVDAGWYDVYTYYGWTLVEDGPTAWGAGTWTLDNGLGAEGNKAKVSVNVNDGLAKSNYAMEDGWYKLGTVYFGGTHTKDIVSFKQTANRPHVDAIKIVTSDYQPAPEPEESTIIMEQSGVDASVGSVTSTGGVGWTEKTHDAFSGGSAVRATYSNTDYTYSFRPIVEAGWYDVYTYYGWAVATDRPFGPWGAGTWTLDNGLSASGDKAAVTVNVNDGLAKNYTLEDGWYKLGTVYFSGVEGKDVATFKQTANLPVVDAVKITKSDYQPAPEPEPEPEPEPDTDPNSLILDEINLNEAYGSISKSGTWNTVTSDSYYGGNALKSPSSSSGKFTFYPKVDAGWYDVFMYKNWKGWGEGTWTIDNGLNESGDKASVSINMNVGKGEDVRLSSQVQHFF